MTRDDYDEWNDDGWCATWCWRLLGLLLMGWLVKRVRRDQVRCSSASCVRCSAMDRAGDAVFHSDAVNSKPYVDVERHATSVKALVGGWEAIRDECEDVWFSEGWASNCTPAGRWRLYSLINQGREIKTNAAKCPRTMHILRELHHRMDGCAFGNACFSAIAPGTNISPHYGPCNVRTRCHLGLRVPEGFSLRVDGIESQWTERGCLLFDDSFLHSVESVRIDCNSAKREDAFNNCRVVLMVDLWGADLSDLQREAIRDAFPTR